MKITSVAKELIEKRIIQARRAVADACAALEAIEKQQTELMHRARAKEKEKSAAEAKLKTLTEASVLNKGVPADILELKNEILTKTAQSVRGDILVSTRTKLETEIPALKEKLQKQCAHPFVVQTRCPYTGSYVLECDDQHEGNRVCAVCGFSENSASSRDDEYEILDDTPERVIIWAGGGGLEKTRLVEKPVKKGGWYRINTLPIGEVIDCFTDRRMIEFLS